MTIYYCHSVRGFFDSDFGYESMPTDGIVVSKEEHSYLLEQINHNRKEISVEDGKLVLNDIIEVPTWDGIKSKRDRELSRSDWTQLPDIDQTTKNAWAEYRQALRDITKTFKTPEEVVWPNKPTK